MYKTIALITLILIGLSSTVQAQNRSFAKYPPITRDNVSGLVEIASLDLHITEVNGVVLIADDMLMMSIDDDGVWRTWNTLSWSEELVQRIPGPIMWQFQRLEGTDNFLIYGLLIGPVYFVNVSSETTEVIIEPGFGSIGDIASTKDGRFFATSGNESVQIWDSTNGNLIRKIDNFLYTPDGVGFSGDGERLVVGSEEGRSVQIFEVESGRRLHNLRGGGRGITVSSDGTMVASTHDDGTYIWSLETGEEIAFLETPLSSYMVFQGNEHLIFSNSGVLSRWSIERQVREVSLTVRANDHSLVDLIMNRTEDLAFTSLGYSSVLRDAVSLQPVKDFGDSSAGFFNERGNLLFVFGDREGHIRVYAVDEDAVTRSNITGSSTATGVCTVMSSRSPNIRQTATTSSPSVGRLNVDQHYPVIGKVTGSDGFVWWQIGNEQWVRSDVVSQIGDCSRIPQN